MAGGYEHALSTQLLATNCIFCGRPLRDPESVQRGYGPDCAEKYANDFTHGYPPTNIDVVGVQTAMELAPDPLRTRWRQIGGDPKDLSAAWMTDPEMRREMLSVGLHYGAMAVSYGSDQLKTVRERVDAALLTIVALQNFADAAGYGVVGQKIRDRFITRLENQDSIRFIRSPARAGAIGVHTPYNDQWLRVARGAGKLFFASEKRDKQFYRFFHERDLGQVVNMLQGVFGDAFCVNPEGQLILLPAMPIPEPVPKTQPAGPPREVTDEVERIPAKSEGLRLGDRVRLPDGSESIIQYLDPKKKRIGCGETKGRGYKFFSFSEVETSSGRDVARDLTKKRQDADRREGIVDPKPEPMVLPRHLPDGLLPHQIVGAAFVEKHQRVIVADEPGLGKQQPIDTNVLTPDGWRRIGSLHVNDFVIGSSGQPVRVLGIYPQGIKPSYRLRFSDKTSVEAGPDHLWTMLYRPSGRGFDTVVVTTEEMRVGATIENRGRSRKRSLARTDLYLPIMSAPATFAAGKNCHLPGYACGQFIANGSLAHGTPALSTNIWDWPEVEQRLRTDGIVPSSQQRYENVVRAAFGGGLLSVVRALELDVLSGVKRIPRIYFTAPVNTRVDLLHGLMDGDGHISKRGNRVTYHTTSPGLADDVVELVECLGGIATVREYDRSHENKPTDYQVRVRLPPSIPPCLVSRKASRYSPGRSTHPMRCFLAAEYVRDVESVCIKVDADDELYVTEHAIVTHNTLVGAVTIDKPAIVVCPALLKVNWIRELGKWRPDLTTALIEGSEEPDPITKSADVVVINYDILAAHVEWLVQLKSRTLIADEAHYLKNLSIRWNKETQQNEPDVKRSPRRAVAFYYLHLGIPKLELLTGTPILNRTKELFPLLHLLNSAEWSSGYQYCIRYCAGHNEWIRVKGGDTKKIFNCSGRSNSDELHRKLTARYMIRHTKAEVLKDLPPKSRRSMSVSLSSEYKKIYKAAAKEFLKWVKQSGGAEKVAKSQRAEALTKLTALRAISAMGKAEAAVNYIAEFFEGTGRPIVVMAVHRQAIDLIAKGIDALNAACEKDLAKGETPDINRPIRYGTVVGGQSATSRQAAIDAFQLRGELDVIIYSIPIATGVTLTKAQDMLFLERMWRPADQVQAEDRCILAGSTVLTERGYQPIENVGVDDKVWTHEGRFRRVTATYSRGYRDLITEIQYRRCNEPLRCTFDHRLLVKRKGCDELSWVEAHRLLPARDFLVIARQAEFGDEITELPFPENLRHDPTQYNQFGAQQRNGRYIRMPDTMPLTEDTLYLLGWYTAEGFASVGGGKGSFLSLAGHTREMPILERQAETIRRVFGVDASIYPHLECEGLELRAFSRELARWFAYYCGNGSHHKKVPAPLLQAGTVQQTEMFLCGYLAGDGYRRYKQQECVTVSPRLAAELVILMNRCGYATSCRLITDGPNKGQWIIGYTKDGKPDSQALLMSDDKYVYHPVLEVKTYRSSRLKKDNDGKYPRVYDLTVEDDHSFVVGNATVHNCHRVGQENALGIVYMDAEGTIDLKLGMLLMDKSTTAAAIIDGVDLSTEAASMLVFGEMFNMSEDFMDNLGEVLGDLAEPDDEDLGDLVRNTSRGPEIDRSGTAEDELVQRNGADEIDSSWDDPI